MAEKYHFEDVLAKIADRYNLEWINLAANVCNFTPVNLGKPIKDGILADIDGIHRVTIDRATERKATI